jgi:hypothetical protein
MQDSTPVTDALYLGRVAAAEDSKSKTNPNVVLVSLSPLTKQRLDALVRAEFFGGTAPAVAKRFIEDGIRRVLERGWLPDSKLPPAANTPSTDGPPDEPGPTT